MFYFNCFRNDFWDSKTDDLTLNLSFSKEQYLEYVLQLNFI